ncbi:MAG: hypothetical protein ABMA64_21680 [Myxococcota bacterium]
MITRIAPPEYGFYSKTAFARGVVIKAHASVPDAALLEAARRVDRLLAGCPTVVSNLERAGAELHLIGRDQAPSDLPMYRHLAGVVGRGGLTIDQRARGYGGLHACCDEDHLLGLPSARHRDGRDTCTHELAHTVLRFGLDAPTRERVGDRFAQASGRWAGAYAATNVDEFFAELSRWWVGPDHRPNHASPRPPGLHALDPESFRLLDGIYRGELPQRPVEWVELPRSVATRSRYRETKTDVVFHNTTPNPIRLTLLDDRGAPVDRGELPPFGVRAQVTWVTHLWVTSDERGERGRYAAQSRPGRVTVR